MTLVNDFDEVTTGLARSLRHGEPFKQTCRGGEGREWDGVRVYGDLMERASEVEEGKYGIFV